MIVVLLTAASYGIWIGLELATKKTFAGEFRMLVSIVAIFAFLSLSQEIISRIFKEKDDSDEQS